MDWDGWFHEKNGYEGGLKKMSMENGYVHAWKVER